MWRHFIIAIRLALVTMILTGIVYPLAVTGMAKALFPTQAAGSIIKHNGVIVGSTLIGQQFNKPGYFHPRPSAAGNGYDAAASCGSNLAPTNRKLVDRVCLDILKEMKSNPGLKSGAIPADMVTTSASGLDPDISLANAYAQVARVAKARGTSVQEVRELIEENTIGRQLGFLGEPRINVLNLNSALDTADKIGIRQKSPSP